MVDSIGTKVVSQGGRLHVENEKIYLTGGLCDCGYMREVLSEKLHCPVEANPHGRYAGAIGAALCAQKVRK